MSTKQVPHARGLLKSAGLGTIAAVLALSAMPGTAGAQDRNGWRNGSDNRSAQSQSQRQSQQATRGDMYRNRSAQQVENRGDQRAATINRNSERRATQVENKGDRLAARAASNGNYQRAERIDRSSERQANRIEQRGDVRARTVDNRSERRADQMRTGTYRTDDRNRTYRDDDRNRDAYYRNNRSWNRDSWRRDSRYDWQRYRSSNRNVYHLGRYYAPYRSYSYHRLNIGFTLGSLFYGNRYWINDPWQYRLPAVDGPYRWVRYYDDVLLVDIYSGEVVDVIYDFFW